MPKKRITFRNSWKDNFNLWESKFIFSLTNIYSFDKNKNKKINYLDRCWVCRFSLIKILGLDYLKSQTIEIDVVYGDEINSIKKEEEGYLPLIIYNNLNYTCYKTYKSSEIYSVNEEIRKIILKNFFNFFERIFCNKKVFYVRLAYYE